MQRQAWILWAWLRLVGVCLQRRFNTLSLLDYYLGPGKLTAQDIAWNPNDPNVLNMALPGVRSTSHSSFRHAQIRGVQAAMCMCMLYKWAPSVQAGIFVALQRCCS